MVFAMIAMTRPLAFLAALALTPLAAACAGGSDNYPSLAIRDAERVEGSFTPAAPDPEPVRPVASPAQLAELLAEAEAAHARFVAALPGARNLVAAAGGAGIDSNTRQRALLALADLSSLRADTTRSLASLDRLEAEARTSFAPAAAIASAQSEIVTMIEAENDALATLAARLGV